jgi:hypothetical protein
MKMAILPRHVNQSGGPRLFSWSELQPRHQRLAQIGLQSPGKLLIPGLVRLPFYPIFERNHLPEVPFFPETKTYD